MKKNSEVYSVYYNAVDDTGKVRFASVSQEDVKDFIAQTFNRTKVLCKIEEVSR